MTAREATEPTGSLGPVEIAEQNDTTEIKSSREIITTTPEASFQSYNFLSNNAVNVREGYLEEGAPRNPEFSYARLAEPSSLEGGIAAIGKAIEAIEVSEPDAEAAVTKNSLEYRKAEMEYIMLLSEIDRQKHDDPEGLGLQEKVVRARDVSEALYGVVDPEIVDASLNEIWGRLDSKRFSGKGRQLLDDLKYGFVSAEGHQVPAMRRSSNELLELPRFNEAMYWAGEYENERNADIQALVNEFWDAKVEEFGEDYVCSPSDIAEAFQRVIDMRDPGHESGVQVKLADGKTALSWETPEMAVLVGANRAPIADKTTLFTRIVHEFGVHGQRALNGFNTDLPVLGTGLYTETPGSQDYLSFEEGYATTIEAAMNGEEDFNWVNGSMNYYLAVAFASEGDDFRSCFEKTWRYMLLANTQEEEISEDSIQRARRSAFTNCVWVFRGNPTDMNGDGASLTYNKDLAYLTGRIKAMKYINEAYEQRDVKKLEEVMIGKFDPTNSVQRELALRYSQLHSGDTED